MRRNTQGKFDFANPHILFKNSNKNEGKKDNNINNSTTIDNIDVIKQEKDLKKADANTCENIEKKLNDDLLDAHPLQNTWTLWYYLFERTKSWKDMLHEITSVATVESFWSVWNHIKPASELANNCDYCLFKKNIQPMWEDSANRNGGRWLIILPRGEGAFADKLWIEVMLLMIGEAFVHGEQITGAVINVRAKNFKISLWTSNGNDEEGVMEIGNTIRDQLHIENIKLQYQLHSQVMVGPAHNVKPLYVLQPSS